MVLNKVWTETFAGRLCGVISTPVLMLLALISGCINLRKPITCFAPAHFTDAHLEFVKQACFDSEYFYKKPVVDPTDPDWSGRPPTTPANYDPPTIPAYYHGVPQLFLCLAIISLMPMLAWRGLSLLTQCPLSAIGDTAKEWMRTSDSGRKDSQARFLASLLDQRRSFIFTVVFLITQIKYVSASLCQFVLTHLLLTEIFGFNNFVHGANIIGNLVQGKPAFKSDSFPLAARCVGAVQAQAGNFFKFETECSLHVNSYQYFLLWLVWFWLLFLVLTSVCSLLYWLTVIFLNYTNTQFVNSRISAKYSAVNSSRPITNTYPLITNKDAMLQIRLLSTNVSDSLATDVVMEMLQKDDVRPDQIKGEADCAV